MRTMNYLEELGEKYNASKRYHDYLKHYHRYFSDIRLSVKKVVEIGVQTDTSVRMWEEYFPNATIYGLDIDPKCKEFERGNVKIFIGDQGDKDFLQSFIDTVGGDIDIVVDDGSHIPIHQVECLGFFLPNLSTHGIYAIEDTGGCVGDVSLETINCIKPLIDNLFFWPKGLPGSEWTNLWTFGDEATWLDKNIVGVSFYRWITFIFRGRNPEDNPYLIRPST